MVGVLREENVVTANSAAHYAKTTIQNNKPFAVGAICARSNGGEAQVSTQTYMDKRSAFRPYLTGSNNAERERLRFSSNLERAF